MRLKRVIKISVRVKRDLLFVKLGGESHEEKHRQNGQDVIRDYVPPALLLLVQIGGILLPGIPEDVVRQDGHHIPYEK